MKKYIYGLVVYGGCVSKTQHPFANSLVLYRYKKDAEYSLETHPWLYKLKKVLRIETVKLRERARKNDRTYYVNGLGAIYERRSG